MYGKIAKNSLWSGNRCILKELRKKLQLDCITTIRNVGLNWRENEKIKDISKNVHTNIFCSWIIIILVHSLVFFIFPKTYLETRKEKIHNIADEILVIWMEKK